MARFPAPKFAGVTVLSLQPVVDYGMMKEKGLEARLKLDDLESNDKTYLAPLQFDDEFTLTITDSGLNAKNDGDPIPTSLGFGIETMIGASLMVNARRLAHQDGLALFRDKPDTYVPNPQIGFLNTLIEAIEPHIRPEDHSKEARAIRQHVGIEKLIREMQDKFAGRKTD